MANLYLIDRPYGSSGLALASEDESPVVVLIQDGVYFDASQLGGNGATVYAIDRDLELRGLTERMPSFVRRIGYPELVDLLLEHKVVNFA